MSREFDVIIYGASGFTGRLVAEYMGKTYGNNANWAMAGRNEAKLAEVRDLVGAPSTTPLVTADAGDSDSLRAMVKRAQCICTTVGPYQLYGSELVKLCAEEGTHYVDLSGEPGWMHEMITSHQAAAEASGARIVHSCGFDSIPFDLGVYFLQKAAIAQTGKPMPRIRGRVRAMNGEFSGGTAASLGATMAALKTNPGLIKILANPFSLANGFQGPDQPSDAKPYEDDVPKPGEGPSKESREAGHYDVLFVGTNDEGGRIEATVTGDMDPGYGSTSKMIAESALCIVHDCPDLPGGVYTPAPAMGEKLLERLVANAGLTFDLGS